MPQCKLKHFGKSQMVNCQAGGGEAVICYAINTQRSDWQTASMHWLLVWNAMAYGATYSKSLLYSNHMSLINPSAGKSSKDLDQVKCLK